MKNRLRLLLIIIMGAIFSAGIWDSSTAQPREAPVSEPEDAPAVGQRKRFSHNTADHKKQSCNSCHQVPTKNWVAARGFPDVADFPSHPSCFSCHQRDIFSGNRPVFCAGCHVNPGPRGAARFPFPVPSRPRQFSIIFPHDKHQNIIARNLGPGDVAVGHFIKAGFSLADDAKPQFNNCATCHQTFSKMPNVSARDLLQPAQPLADPVKDNFAAKAEFFKTSPETHVSCFTCHYQNQQPIATNCAGCHRLTAPFSETKGVQRYSVKFDHQFKDHASRDCTSCHIRITQSADLKSMKDADVPIQTCASCHSKNVNEEIGKREASIQAKEPVFQCNYCHSPEIGRFPIPPSHKVQ